MSSVRRTVGILVLALGFALPAVAQDSKALIIQVSGGGVTNLATLDRNGQWDTKTAAGFSGSIGLKVIDRFVVRGDVVYTASPIRFQGTELTPSADFTRVFVSLIAQIQFPQPSGFNPYLLFGGGSTFINQHTTADPKKTAGHGVGGAGLAYRLGGGALSILAEGRVYLYQPRGIVGGSDADNRVLWDGAFGAGLSYAFALGALGPRP